MRWVVVACLLAACVEDGAVYCERVCPEGTICTATGCAQPAQLEACVGIAEGGACATPTITNGTCVEGVCVMP